MLFYLSALLWLLISLTSFAPDFPRPIFRALQTLRWHFRTLFRVEPERPARMIG